MSEVTNDKTKPRIISREEWMAQPPINHPEPLGLPISRVIIAHTSTENCSSQVFARWSFFSDSIRILILFSNFFVKLQIDCTYQVRQIQTFHMESRGFNDIAYNYLVGGDGAIYVGIQRMKSIALNSEYASNKWPKIKFSNRSWLG